jgi:Carbamoyl-phosphate synthase L chain, ATP binding domain
VLDAGLTWIGPPPAVLRLLGDKLAARQLARHVGAPLLPGMTTPVSDVAEVAAFAREHGLPPVIKTAFGGRGRGVTVARSAGEIPRSYARAVHAAAAAGRRTECFAERKAGHGRGVRAARSRSAVLRSCRLDRVEVAGVRASGSLSTIAAGNLSPPPVWSARKATEPVVWLWAPFRSGALVGRRRPPCARLGAFRGGGIPRRAVLDLLHTLG